MRRRVAVALYSLLFFLMFAGRAYATDGSFADQFLGSPLLILVAVIIIDVIAFIYHKIRK